MIAKKLGKLVIMLSLVSVISLLFTSHSYSENNSTWYVTQHGNDADSCRSPNTACASVRAVLDKPDFAPMDTIFIEHGGYGDSGIEGLFLDKSVVLSGGWDWTFSAKVGVSGFGSSSEDGRIGINVRPDVTAEFENIVTGAYGPMGSGQVGLLNYGSLTVVQTTDYPYATFVGDYGIGIDNSGTLTITGGGSIGKGSQSIFNDGVMTINDFKVDGEGGSCPGIVNLGLLYINNTVLTGISGRYGSGTAICNTGSVVANRVTIVDNFISNTIDPGGGIINEGDMTLVNSTIAFNGGEGGAGIYNGAGGLLEIYSSTIVENMSDVAGGGIWNDGGEVYVQNSIISNNVTYDENGDPVPSDCRGPIISQAYNLIGSTDGCEWQTNTGDVLDREPYLWRPAPDDYLYPLLPYSPARDAGNPDGCRDHEGNLLTTDQRGLPRGGRCDSGATEYTPGVDPVAVWLPIIQ